MDHQKIWQAVLGELEVTMSRPNFSTWLKNTALDDVSGETARIIVPSVFAKEWLQRKFLEDILAAIGKHAPDIKRLDFKVGQIEKPVTSGASAAVSDETGATSTASAPTETQPMGTAPQNTFQNFVVGNSNQLAYAAAQAVAKNPGTIYNPLFIYGSAGLGKTHLMKAIGQEIEQTTEKRSLFVSAEKFTNELISAMTANKMARFKDRYRRVDVLMLDDVQFMAGKVRTQEEFFHTFSALNDEGKQVILTSDRPPKAIATFEDRLVSRLSMGMIADLGPPELETRIAILRTKAKERGYNVSDEVLDYIAKSFQQNVRELEGALIRVVAHAELTNTELSKELAEKVLGSMLTNREHRQLSTVQIIEAVSKFYDVSIDDLKGPKRQKEIVKPRQLIMFLLREEASLSYPKIGQELGGRDHTTVIHAVEKINRQSEINEPLRHELDLIKERLYA